MGITKEELTRLLKAKEELIRLLKKYHFRDSEFYEKNKGLIQPVTAKSSDEDKFEIRKDDTYSWAAKKPGELIVYFKQGKKQHYECVNLERMKKD